MLDSPVFLKHHNVQLHETWSNKTENRVFFCFFSNASVFVFFIIKPQKDGFNPFDFMALNPGQPSRRPTGGRPVTCSGDPVTWKTMKESIMDLDTSGYIWIHLDTSGYIWIHLDTSGYIWMNYKTLNWPTGPNASLERSFLHGGESSQSS